MSCSFPLGKTYTSRTHAVRLLRDRLWTVCVTLIETDSGHPSEKSLALREGLSTCRALVLSPWPSGCYPRSGKIKGFLTWKASGDGYVIGLPLSEMLTVWRARSASSVGQSFKIGLSAWRSNCHRLGVRTINRSMSRLESGSAAARMQSGSLFARGRVWLRLGRRRIA